MARIEFVDAANAAEIYVPTPAEIRAAELVETHAGVSGLELVDLAVKRLFAGEIAVVSSFGAESAVLLHLLSEVDRSVPVLFVDTDKHFGETLRYRDQLVARLGLTDVRTLTPDPARLKEIDPKGILWRFQAATRAAIPAFEAEAERIKVNPLAEWGPMELQAYADKADLPPHPLVAQGYPSIGCMPCTAHVAAGEDARAG
eukprot:gene21753-22712_t